MKFVFFVHSAVSDWNHGNAHFIRGLMSALTRMGHDVVSYEPRGAWSVENLLRDHGVSPIVDFARAYPEIDVRSYDPRSASLSDELAAAVAGADVVLVHEWNDPNVVNALPPLVRAAGGIPLFHDTHHRPWSDPESIARFHLQAYDGVLAFGDVLRDVYRERFAVERAWTFHEAADVERFRPLDLPKTTDVIWIGNWGDEERTQELWEFLLAPVQTLRLHATVFGVRYPSDARAALRLAGCSYEGWLPNFRVPAVFAQFPLTVHIPRRAYVRDLPGVPTIRPFEAMACGIPLVSAPWHDVEGLFSVGKDFLMARTQREMASCLRAVLCDRDLADELSSQGRQTILSRHTCGHRVDELLHIHAQLQAPSGTPMPAGAAREKIS